MSKKTRREKIIADYRKKLRLTYEVPASLQTGAAPSYSVRPPAPRQNPTLALDPKELSAITADLLKTVVLAALAITIEIGLYWMWK